MIFHSRSFHRYVVALLTLLPFCAHAEDVAYFIPQFLGAQYTFVDQHQDALRSPYAGPLSLDPRGDTEQSHTFGAYFGVPLSPHLQFYFDMEMFKGEGVSGATGLGGLPNGDVIRSGTNDLGKRPYVARRYLRYLLPLSDGSHTVEGAQDQLAGDEPDTHMEFKLGKFAASDDFDKNKYANSTRTQFMNWSLFNDTAWDFAADTRGYSNGALIAYVTPAWALRYGIFQMPRYANGQTLEWPLTRARGEQIEFALQPNADSWAVRLLAFHNIARMGIYAEAIAIAAANDTIPDIRADDRDGRRKYGFGANAELPLADGGETGLFARAGWNDGHTESFAFTEVDRTFSSGAQLSGTHWNRAQDHLGLALVVDGLSRDHRDYLAAGGSGFLLGDGKLNYAREQIAEAYYQYRVVAHVDLEPDIQFVRDPGYNRDRGPARFVGLRAHIEF
jgi:high affinity Mn2+ porin